MKFHSILSLLLPLVVTTVTKVDASNSYSSANAYGKNWYVDSINATYDGYQQAWRYLGHMIKCGYPTARYYEQSHSHDSGDGENKYRGNNWCQRYLMWAAVSKVSSIVLWTDNRWISRSQFSMHGYNPFLLSHYPYLSNCLSLVPSSSCLPCLLVPPRLFTNSRPCYDGKRIYPSLARNM